MADLTIEYNRPMKGRYIFRRMKMGAEKIYKGMGVMVVRTTGYVVKAADTAKGQFVGVAEETVDNSAGSPGDLSILVRCGGDELFPQAATTIEDVGKLAYAIDSHLVSVSSSNNVALGRIVGVEDATHVWIGSTGTQKTSDES